MARMMVGLFLLFATSVSSPVAPVSPAAAERPAIVSATARSTATIRIISGVRFGPSHTANVAGATRRKGQLIDADGRFRPAELLEFQ
jgi:hypothetical protein